MANEIKDAFGKDKSLEEVYEKTSKKPPQKIKTGGEFK